MDKVDKTKENIGVTNLDEQTRKKLFNKFVESGGEIIDEKSKKKNLTIDRNKQKQYQQQFEKHGKNTKTMQKNQRNKNIVRNKNVPDSSPAVNSFLNYINNLKIRLKLKFLKVTQFNGYYFNVKFLEKFNNIYSPALIEIQMIYLEIFRKNPKAGFKIIQRLDKLKPLYFELIEMIGNVYDKITIEQIVEHYIDFPDVPKKISELKQPLMEMYRRLYMLMPYENTIYDGYTKAVELYAKVDESRSSISSMKKKLKKGIFVVFHKLYPRLHLLFCHYEGKLFDIDDPEIERILSINDAEKPGNRKGYIQQQSTPTDVFEEEVQDNTSKEDEEDKKDGVSEAVKKGLEVMYQLDLKKLRKKYDKLRLFENVTENDKVLIAYLLYSEFDSEYSFILTTNKIKYNVDFSPDGKVDYKDKLQELYDEMRVCTENLKEYAEELTNYEKVRHEKPIGNTQYIEYTKRLESIQKKRKESGRMARATLKTYMNKISGVLKTLIDDMDGPQKYIANPQEVLQLESYIEGDKKINNKKVYEAILIVYYYASAFVSRLESGGDLSGNLEFNEGESGFNKMTEDTDDIDVKPEDLNKQDNDKSILDELDDML